MLKRVTKFRREAAMGYDNQTDHGQWGQLEVLWTAHDVGMPDHARESGKA